MARHFLAAGFAGVLLWVATWTCPSGVRAHDPGTEGELCPTGWVGCEAGDLAWFWSNAAFDAVMFDTGWVPPGAAIQLRFAFYLGGETEIEMEATGLASWPLALDIHALGHPDSGVLRINYGAELIAQMRFDVTVAGIRYRWMGDIPIGDFPMDLRMASETEFDPLLLPGSSPRPVEVADTTERFTVFSYDAIGMFVPVPGVGGGVRADVQGGLTARYRTDRVVVMDAADIVEEGAGTVKTPGAGEIGFGAGEDVVMHPEGTLEYEGVLTVWPVLYLEIAGRTMDYELAEIPIPIVTTESNVIFDDETFHVPLPDIDVDPTMIAFGERAVGTEHEVLIVVSNDGEAELRVEPRMVGAPFGVAAGMLVLAPRTETRLAVRYVPEEVGSDSALMQLVSNDPDEPVVVVRLSGLGIAEIADAGPPKEDAGPGDSDAGTTGGDPGTDGGCGCRTVRTGNLGALPVAMVVALAAWVRRRRPNRR